MCATSFSRFTQRSLRLRRAHSRCHRISSHTSPKASTTLLRPQLLCLLPVGADYRAGSPTGKAPPFRDACFRSEQITGRDHPLEKPRLSATHAKCGRQDHGSLSTKLQNQCIHTDQTSSILLLLRTRRAYCLRDQTKGRDPFISLNFLLPGHARSPVRVSSGYQCRAPNPIPRSGPRRHGRDVAPALDTGFRKTDSRHNRWS